MKRPFRLARVCLALACLPGLSKADVVIEWNNLLLDSIRNESTSPPLAARNLAILHVAIFEAVNAVEPVYEPYLFAPTPPPGASAEAAAVGAAYECLVNLYPSQAASFDAGLNRFLDTTAATTNREAGLTFGQWTALWIVSWRSADGSSTTVPYIPLSEPGAWRRTPPFFRPPELPQWPDVMPFALTNGAQFRPPGPPPLDSVRYAMDVNQVKQLGGANSTNRTAEQTLVARFWSDFSYTATPPGHWNLIGQNVATNRTQSLLETARLFALLNITMADAGIAVWDAKYFYNFWRPVTAIQQADLDGNPDTEADPNWTPLLNTPPFPEYVSGHSTFSAGAATVLAAFCGTDHVRFTVSSDALPGVFRSYDSFAAAAEEIGLSRIYGGIHFLSADLDGLETGRRVGAYVCTNFLRPIPARTSLNISQLNSDNRLRLAVTGTLGSWYVLEASTNLADWTPVFTNQAPFTFEDTAGGSSPIRFYRASGSP